jgi:hypothetical protein
LGWQPPTQNTIHHIRWQKGALEDSTHVPVVRPSDAGNCLGAGKLPSNDPLVPVVCTHHCFDQNGMRWARTSPPEPAQSTQTHFSAASFEACFDSETQEAVVAARIGDLVQVGVPYQDCS